MTDLRPSYTSIFFHISRDFLRGLAARRGACYEPRSGTTTSRSLPLFGYLPGNPTNALWLEISSTDVPAQIQRQRPLKFTAFLSWHRLLSPGMNVPVSLQACSGLTSRQVLIETNQDTNSNSDPEVSPQSHSFETFHEFSSSCHSSSTQPSLPHL